MRVPIFKLFLWKGVGGCVSQCTWRACYSKATASIDVSIVTGEKGEKQVLRKGGEGGGGTPSPQALHFQHPFLLSAGEKGLPFPLWKGKRIRSCTPSSIVFLKVHGSFSQLKPQSEKKKKRNPFKDGKFEQIRYRFGGKTVLTQEPFVQT